MIPISTLAPAASFASSVLEQFKPSRAPYLLAVSIGALFIGLTLESDSFDTNRQMLVILPIYAVIFVLSVLAFYFKPFEEKDLTDKQESIESDIDTQFKLARTTGLITGIACLYMVAYRRDAVDIIYVLIWIIVLIHCIIFLIYIMFRNIKEESSTNKSYFQLSFLTSLFLFLLTFSGSKMADFYYLYDKCSVTVEFSGTPNEPPITDPKDKIVNGSSSPDSGLPRNYGNLNLCSTKLSDVEAYLDSRYDAVADIKINGLSTTPPLHFITMGFFATLWGIYIVFWVIQITRIWSKSSMIISD